ncbi:MAG: antitoxin VbhA family protein [Caryophanon sp.]|nr:antitoxin VbhA family protein [Caryophanon sp.]
MKNCSQLDRRKQTQSAIAIAAINGGRPTEFTQHLLKQYEDCQITSRELKQAIIQHYTKASKS